MRLKGKDCRRHWRRGRMGRGAALKLAQEGAAIEILDRQDAAQACEAIRRTAAPRARWHATRPTIRDCALRARAIEDRHGRTTSW